MPDHERGDSPLLLRQCQEPRRKLAHHVAVERHMARDPKAVEDREQQQRVFGDLSKRLYLIDQQTCLLRGRLGFRRRIAFGVHESVHKLDLKLDDWRRSLSQISGVYHWAGAARFAYRRRPTQQLGESQRQPPRIVARQPIWSPTWC